jgi:uncharacterized protein (DUF1800 family)
MPPEQLDGRADCRSDVFSLGAMLYEILTGRPPYDWGDGALPADWRHIVAEAQLRQWWLRRMAQSPRPLQEKLTLFWHDHFAVNYREAERTHIIYKQNQLLREHAGENFGALLHAIVQDPAMIRYLDNHRNNKGKGNENLGRELQELFSIGEQYSANHADDGYTEDDVREASRALTGYTYDAATDQFHFLGSRHDATNKTVLGKTGPWSGDDVVNIILAHRSTARYVAGKLFEHFVHRTPDEQTVERIAHVLRGNNYEMRPFLRNLFLSEQFYGPAAMASNVKSPAELMIGTIRILGLEQPDYAAVDSAMQQMGMTLFEPPNVAGWEEGQAWISADLILTRYNHVANLIQRDKADLVAVIERADCKTAEQVIDHFVRCFLVTPLAQEKRQALIDYLGELPPGDQWQQRRNELNGRLRDVIVLLLSTPHYQVG